MSNTTSKWYTIQAVPPVTVQDIWDVRGTEVIHAGEVLPNVHTDGLRYAYLDTRGQREMLPLLPITPMQAYLILRERSAFLSVEPRLDTGKWANNVTRLSCYAWSHLTEAEKQELDKDVVSIDDQRKKAYARRQGGKFDLYIQQYKEKEKQVIAWRNVRDDVTNEQRNQLLEEMRRLLDKIPGTLPYVPSTLYASDDAVYILMRDRPDETMVVQSKDIAFGLLETLELTLDPNSSYWSARVQWYDPLTLLLESRTFPVYKILREGTDDPLLKEWGIPKGTQGDYCTIEEFNQLKREQREKDAK